MKYADVIKKLNDNGIEISKPTLYKESLRCGFAIKVGKKFYFNSEKLSSWIEQQITPPPENYINVKQIIMKYNVSQTCAYKMINDKRLKDDIIIYHRAGKVEEMMVDGEKLRDIVYEYKQNINYKSRRGASVYDTDWL